jgi:hypothetical protein
MIDMKWTLTMFHTCSGKFGEPARLNHPGHKTEAREFGQLQDNEHNQPDLPAASPTDQLACH